MHPFIHPSIHPPTPSDGHMSGGRLGATLSSSQLGKGQTHKLVQFEEDGGNLGLPIRVWCLPPYELGEGRAEWGKGPCVGGEESSQLACFGHTDILAFN